LLASSDQPVVPVPLIAPHASVPVAAIPQTGLLSTFEYRIALDPRHALVMCWLDEPYAKDPVPGDYRVAANLNIATAGQAEKHAYWPSEVQVPFVCAPEVGGLSDVVSLSLSPRYTLAAVRRSRRRERTRAILEGMIEEGIKMPGKIETVSVTQRDAA